MLGGDAKDGRGEVGGEEEYGRLGATPSVQSPPRRLMRAVGHVDLLVDILSSPPVSPLPGCREADEVRTEREGGQRPRAARTRSRTERTRRFASRTPWRARSAGMSTYFLKRSSGRARKMVLWFLPLYPAGASRV